MPTPTPPTTPATLGTLLRLAWPIVLSRSAQAVVGFCDALMVAPLGATALAAVTAGSLNTFCVTILPIGVVVMVQTFAAQLSGAGDPGGARRYAWYALALSTLAGGVALAALPAVGPVVARLDYAPDVRAAMTTYMAVRLAAMTAMVGVEALAAWFGGVGNTRIGMLANVVVMVANVGLNALLIEGRLGFPAMGVAGAAWASVIAAWLGLGMLVVGFVAGIGAPREPAGRLRLDELARLLRFGVPSGFNWFFEFSAFVLFVNVTVASLGTVTTAALLAVMQVNAVSFMPAFGLASAGAILAGQAIGAGRRDDVPHIAGLAVRATAAWQVAVGVAYVIGAGPIMRWFAAEPELAAVGAVLLTISAAWQLFDAIGIATSEVLRAAGDTVFPLVARLVIAWALFVPGSFAAVSWAGGGGAAAMASIAAYLGLLAVVLVLRFRSGAWRAFELTSPA